MPSKPLAQLRRIRLAGRQVRRPQCCDHRCSVHGLHHDLTTASGVQPHELDADDLLSLMRCHHVPNGHVVRRQVQFIGTRQRVIPGERIRTRRSLTDSPGLRELTARQGKRGVTRTRVRLNARPSHTPPDLAPKPPHLSLQRVEFGTRDSDHLGCFDAHARLPPLSTVTAKSRRGITASRGLHDAHLAGHRVPVACP